MRKQTLVMSVSRKAIFAGAILLLFPLVGLWVWLNFVLRAEFGRFAVEPGVEFRLLIEHDWDVGDTLLYEVRESGVEKVPKFYLCNHDRHRKLTILTASSKDGAVVGLWAKENATGDFPVFILFHLPSGESWPRLRSDEVSYDASVRAKWLERYLSLRRDSPDLPAPTYFTTAGR